MVSVHSERREHLKAYLASCFRDGNLTWNDLLANPDKLLKVLSKDVKIILKEAGRDGSVNFLRVGAAMLAGFAEKILTGK